LERHDDEPPPTSTVSSTTAPARRPAAARLSPLQVHELVADLLGEDVHATRVLSFARGVVGVLHAAALGVHAIGRGLAQAMGLEPKHAIKQVDRLLSNSQVIKDNHFGMGLSATHIHSAQRRDRLLLLAAVAHALVTLLGAAGEACGLDRTLKANTVKTRTMSLYNQGCWYRAIPRMREDRLVQLMTEFGRLVSEHAAFCEIFGLI
jgi:hypothetical protein